MTLIKQTQTICTSSRTRVKILIDVAKSSVFFSIDVVTLSEKKHKAISKMKSMMYLWKLVLYDNVTLRSSTKIEWDGISLPFNYIALQLLLFGIIYFQQLMALTETRRTVLSFRWWATWQSMEVREADVGKQTLEYLLFSQKLHHDDVCTSYFKKWN
jgi:hypothetical protein